MGTNLQKIKELLLSSHLSPSQQESLIVLFSRTRDYDLGPVVKLFSEDSAWIEKISGNYQAKQSAIAVQDLSSWQKIVQEEEMQLKELEK